MRLLPREEKFFKYFLRQVQLCSEAARLLASGVRNGDAALADAAAKIVLIEEAGDEVIHEVHTLLNSTFITPLDPEDIHSLASHLDDVLDGIEETAHRTAAYNIGAIPPRVIEVCDIIVNCCEALQKAFAALADGKQLLEHCIEINRQEGLADRVVRQAIADLFQHEKDPIQLLRLKEVYEVLEKTTDFCEDVADVLQGVVVKNS